MNIHDPAIETQEDVIRPSQAEAEAAVQTLLRWAGDNPLREGLQDTPGLLSKHIANGLGVTEKILKLCFNVLLKRLKDIMKWFY